MHSSSVVFCSYWWGLRLSTAGYTGKKKQAPPQRQNLPNGVEPSPSKYLTHIYYNKYQPIEAIYGNNRSRCNLLPCLERMELILQQPAG